MKREIFNKLMQNTICDTGLDLETVGFRSKYGVYELSFYVEIENGTNIIIEDFGLLKEGKWQQLEPTKKQINELQEMANKEISYIEEMLSKEY